MVKKQHKKKIHKPKHETKHVHKAYQIHKIKKKPSMIDKAKLYLAVVLGVLLLINFFLLSGLNKTIDEKAAEAKEMNKPAFVQLHIIADSKCSDCFDISQIVERIKRGDVNVTEEKELDFTSTDAKQLISKYGIEKIPTVIVTGETNKTNIRELDEKEDALVFMSVKPAYTDAASGKIIGRVDVMQIKERSCTECKELNQIISQFKQGGVTFSEEKIVYKGDREAEMLIKKYDITLLPTLVLSKDLEAYTEVTGNWQLFGTVEKDGSYVVRTSAAIGVPYYDLETKQVKGLVDVTYLTDESCDECYDVNVHKNILVRNFKIKLREERIVDISEEEGKQLIAKYNITKVPTIVITKEANAYQALVQVWANVGTVEDDGTFVFRNIAVMRGSAYKDLSTGEIVK